MQRSIASSFSPQAPSRRISEMYELVKQLTAYAQQKKEERAEIKLLLASLVQEKMVGEEKEAVVAAQPVAEKAEAEKEVEAFLLLGTEAASEEEVGDIAMPAEEAGSTTIREQQEEVKAAQPEEERGATTVPEEAGAAQPEEEGGAITVPEEEEAGVA